MVRRIMFTWWAFQSLITFRHIHEAFFWMVVYLEGWLRNPWLGSFFSFEVEFYSTRKVWLAAMADLRFRLGSFRVQNPIQTWKWRSELFRPAFEKGGDGSVSSPSLVWLVWIGRWGIFSLVWLVWMRNWDHREGEDRFELSILLRWRLTVWFSRPRN